MDDIRDHRLLSTQFLDLLEKRFSPDELHDNIKVFFCLEIFVNLDDVGVVQR